MKEKILDIVAEDTVMTETKTAEEYLVNESILATVVEATGMSETKTAEEHLVNKY